MSQWSQTPPALCAMSQCDSGLDFSPQTKWPTGLPAVAVNQVVLAGFSQDVVFNHQINFTEADQISSLFRSLYFELNFAELVRLIEKAKNYSWFPLSSVIAKFGWQPTEHFFQIIEKFKATPAGFQSWCAEKKVAPQDLSPLLSAQNLDLKFLFLDILNLQLSKSMGIKALELGIELMLMGQKPEHLQSTFLLNFISKEQTQGEAWLDALKQLRYPETYKRDQAEAQKWASLPWPGTSQAKWTRMGDRGGIELKLFVSHPTDLKKYLQSLSRVQDLIEKEQTETQH